LSFSEAQSADKSPSQSAQHVSAQPENPKL